MEFALEEPFGRRDVCDTCAERGRPVHKLGMCKFCYYGLPHPNATREQLAREKTGMVFTKRERSNLSPHDNVL